MIIFDHLVLCSLLYIKQALLNIIACLGWGIGIALSIRVALWLLDVKL